MTSWKTTRLEKVARQMCKTRVALHFIDSVKFFIFSQNILIEYISKTSQYKLNKLKNSRLVKQYLNRKVRTIIVITIFVNKKCPNLKYHFEYTFSCIWNFYSELSNMEIYSRNNEFVSLTHLWKWLQFYRRNQKN